MENVIELELESRISWWFIGFEGLGLGRKGI